MKTLIFAILAGLCCPAFARLGENHDELVARYGESKPGTAPGEFLFHKNGIFVTATIWKSRCHKIKFSNKPPLRPQDSPFGGGFVLPGDTPIENEKPATDAPKESAPLTDHQVGQLLAANAGGSTWKESRKDMWITEDGKFSAYLLKDASLTIVTDEYLTFQVEEQKKSESEKTEGF